MTVLKESVHLVAIDLFGEAVGEAEKELPFKADENYYRTVGGFVNSFAASLPAEPSRILGVGIAIQGLVAADGGSIIYGTILNNGGMTCRDFQQYLDYPCRLIHDTEASATAELWKNDRIENAAYLVLNRNMGGVLIVNRAIYRGSVLGSGIVEHMTLRPDGARCYCGKHGCVEAYCSANSLRQRSGQPFDLFFQNLRAGEKRSEQIWAEYLRDLALAIDNIRMLADCQVILAGFLQQYLTEKDLEQLAGYVQKESAFPDMSIDIVMGKCGSHASTLGAGLHYIRHFLHQIGSAEKLPTEA